MSASSQFDWLAFFWLIGLWSSAVYIALRLINWLFPRLPGNGCKRRYSKTESR